MANIPISDGFGLDLQANLDPKSAFAKYFQHPPSFSVLEQNLASVQDVPLTGFPLKSTEIGLAFTQRTSVATASPQFAGSAAVAATLCVVTGGKLFDPDPYSSPIEVPAGRTYLGLGVKATLAPGGDITSGKLAFGFTAGSTVCLSHYRSFATTPTAPTFRAALQASLEDYVIPLSPDDLASLGIGDVATIEGTGSIQLTGTFNLLTSVNPLVSVTSAALAATIQVKEGAKIAISACLTITGDLQIRIQKVDTGTVRMGFYRKRGGDFTIQVNPSVGITAGTASVDFISGVLGVIGPNPLPSADELEKAGLAKEKQASIESALKAGIQRSLQLSIQEQLLASSSQEVAFLYEISLNDLGPDGHDAIQDALRLNLSTLSESPQSLPRGIREIQNLLTTTRTTGHSLKMNLLGIYNFTSVSDLILKGTVLTDPASGEIVITDTATANQVSGAINFLANPDKLRKVLAQSFLITAAYRCSGLIAHPPSLKASYWHFDEHAQTDRVTMAANLHVLNTMGLISATQEEQSLTLGTAFGHSTFYVTTDYNDALSQGLFLKGDGQPRARSEYEQVGRKAMQLLLQASSEDDFRLRPLQDDAIWQQVQATGGTLGNLAELFPDLSPDRQIPVIAGDYVLIAWWATTMANMGQSLGAARRFFSTNPPPSSDSPAFAKVQSDLWHQMADVARDTHDRFSDPWGLLAMDLASGQKSVASARLLASCLTLTVERIASP